MPLRTLLDAFEQPSSCIVLGAGASVPIVPSVAQLQRLVRRRLLAIGVFPAETVTQDEVGKRVLGGRREYFSNAEDALALEEELVANHLSPAAVRAATVALLRPEPPSFVPPQYGVFSLARHTLMIINYNNDGLAAKYCGHHIVVNVHGSSLTKQDRERLAWEKWIDTFQKFPGLSGIDVPGLLLPQREPETLKQSLQYRAVKKCLSAANRLVLIGYSFGQMDDHIAYESIIDSLKHAPIPTLLIQPEPRDLQERLAEESKSPSIFVLPAYWDSLSEAIMFSTTNERRRTCNHRKLCAECVAYYYEAFLDLR
jgi:hypothetical protein